MHHEDCFLDFDSADVVPEHRKRIEPEVHKVIEAARMENSWIPVCGKVEPLVIDDHDFFQLRQQHHSANWRLGRGRQQTVIAAGIHPPDRRGGEATDAIRFQPLTLQ
jgi:hypothetical protein